MEKYAPTINCIYMIFITTNSNDFQLLNNLKINSKIPSIQNTNASRDLNKQMAELIPKSSRTWNKKKRKIDQYNIYLYWEA